MRIDKSTHQKNVIGRDSNWFACWWSRSAPPARNTNKGKLAILNNDIGKGISGKMVLEIPVQSKPIPQSVLDRANLLNIDIRDVQGKIYN